MHVYDASQQPPRPPLPVNVEHPQDLEEADPADGGRGDHLAVVADGEHRDGGEHADQVWCRVDLL